MTKINEARKLRLEVEYLRRRLALAEAELEEIVKKCQPHVWKDPVLDQTYPIIPRWTRECSQCGTVEDTRQFDLIEGERIPLWRG